MDERDMAAAENSLSVLFITFNRSDLLQIAFDAFRNRAGLDNSRTEFIVSDDASAIAHVDRIRSMPFDMHLLADRNAGLGNNQNKAIAAATGTLILQVQDDCEFVGDTDLMANAFEILKAEPGVGIVQFNDLTPHIPHEVRTLQNGTVYRVFRNDLQEIARNCDERPYSDQPHLKRAAFCRDIGPYREAVPMTVMELDFKRRVACQERWTVAVIVGRPSFVHIGAERSFNPGAIRSRRLARIEAVPIAGGIFKFGRPYAKFCRDWLRLRLGRR
ncbi:glycosyltransferase family 2 protein [Massilia sp. R2A-15]|uniref:glycosyltransferase family A protein n=1 Tax=Massilia sp. R2A-15 TaxID=3064278 RepID=UPI00273705E1|nr:glycosyltransferase family 2 protein [Massilia sp. R2A-15]WLI88020.1 glycosyltransferase family 2 protein [Massilia sp. R2A-15]